MREARVIAARRCTAWTEITPPERLCARGPTRYAWHVDANSDQIFVPLQGAAFLPHSASIIADRVPLAFTVDDDGRLSVFERLTKPATWSDVIRTNPELATQ